MAVQLYVYDDLNTRYEVDLYKDEPIKITLSAESLGDIPTIDSAFSRQFRVPATQNNSKVFKWWYEVNTVDFDVTKKIKSEIHVDGILYKTGHTRINAAYVNNETTQVDLELVFFGETKDFSTQVGDGFLPDLDLSALNHKLTIDNIEKSWLPLTDPSVLVDGGVRWILADRGYTYSESGGTFVADQNEIALTAVGNYNKSFHQNSRPIALGQMTPMIQVKKIIDAIFDRTDYTYSNDSVFNEDWFKELYTDGLPEPLPITPMTNGDFEVGAFPQIGPIGTVVETRVPFTNVITDNASAFQTLGWKYVAPQTITTPITFEVDLDLNISRFPAYPSPTFITRLYKNNTVIATDTHTTPVGIIPYAYTASISHATTLNQGDELYVTLQILNAGGVGSLAPSSRFKASGIGLTMSVANLVKRNVKSIDFLKSILSKFRLIMTPSTSHEYEFIIQPFKDYIGSGDRLDWTGKLDNSKDITLLPVFYDQSQRINFTDVEDIDKMNEFHKDEYDRVYGQLYFDSKNELLLDTKEIKTEFAPTPVNQIEGALPTSNFIIPFFTKHGNETADHGHTTHEPMTPKPRLLFWNGSVTVGGSEDWYMEGPDDAGVTVKRNYLTYPRMTYLSEVPSLSTTLNLNWFREFAYFEISGGPAGRLGESVYERYWNRYIQSLYSPLARKLTAYFTIDAQDLRVLSFDDLIFLNNAYYRVVKVYDAPLTDISTVKVDLIKILDSELIANGGTPTDTGGGIDPDVPTGGGGTDIPVDENDIWNDNNNNFGTGNGQSWSSNYYYVASDCDATLPNITVKSVGPLSAGTVVNVSGSGYVGTCWTIVDYSAAPEDTTVLDVFATCIECQTA